MVVMEIRGDHDLKFFFDQMTCGLEDALASHVSNVYLISGHEGCWFEAAVLSH